MPYTEPANPGQSNCSSVSNGRTLIGDADYFPCGPVNATTAAVPCCRRDHTCLEGGLCSYLKRQGEDEDADEDGKEHEKEQDDSPVITSYYASGCTDPSFADPACKRLCVNWIAGDVIYSGTSWRCCADHKDVDCAKPKSDETFNLPPPSALKAYFHIPATGFAFTSAALPTSTPSASSAAPGASDSSLAAPGTSGGAPLGQGVAIGVGVGVASFAVLVAWSAWFIARRARAKRLKRARSTESPDDGGDGIADPFATPRPRHSELESPLAEKPRLESASHRHLTPELPGSAPAVYELSAEPPSSSQWQPVSPLSPAPSLRGRPAEPPSPLSLAAPPSRGRSQPPSPLSPVKE